MNPHEQLEQLRSSDGALGLRRILEQILRPGLRVLDAGCGVGLYALWAARAGATVVAVDLGQNEPSIQEHICNLHGRVQPPAGVAAQVKDQALVALVHDALELVG